MALPAAVPWASPMTTPTFRDLQDRVHETQREGEERYYLLPRAGVGLVAHHIARKSM
jgi:hypothetical protein